jgi:hypothetical protein
LRPWIYLCLAQVSIQYQQEFCLWHIRHVGHHA